MNNKLLFLTIILVLCSGLLFSQIPEGYYNSAEGLQGEALKAALNDIISGHTVYPYTSTSIDVWDILKESDRDPNNSANVILLYTGWSVNAAQEYNAGSGWTREHCWAKSHGFDDMAQPAYTDCHHLRPADVSVNSARNNRWYAECNEQYFDAGGTIPTDSWTSSTDWVWKPRDEVKGDCARMIFYMATRYEGEYNVAADVQEIDLEVIDYLPADNNSVLPEMAKLSDLLLWSEQDPVDEFEVNRNEVVYGYQGNRNPFVDHPEWVCKIFGSSCTNGPTIVNISHSPSNPVTSDIVTVNAEIADDGSVSSASVLWGTDHSTFPNSESMTIGTAPTYSATIADQPAGTTVYYKITATDNDAETTTTGVYSYTIPQDEPTNYPTSFAIGTTTSSSIQISWSDASAGTLPHAYIIKASAISLNDISSPVDGTEESDAPLVKNISQGTQTVTFSGLTSNTTYYFKIYSYSNSGINIDYKIDGTPPNTSTITDVAGLTSLETFANYTVTGSTYSDGTFSGQDGSIWTYNQCRGDKSITAETPCLGKDRSPVSEVYSGIISGGCGTLSFDYMQAFSSNVNMELYVNDLYITSVTSSGQQDVVLNSGEIIINEPGEFTFKFINTSSSAGQVSIDNINWSSYSGIGVTENSFIQDFDLFPNPTNAIVCVSGAKNVESVSILNILGKELKQTNEFSKGINVSDLPKGQYIVVLKGKFASVAKSLVITY
ncbi:MAG: endonuclease [Salinivirgaceae bacterium]|nr:endonuclease [Salinivirgaceae bacterium]